MHPRLELSRTQILNFRRKTGCLDKRLTSGPASLRKAAWAGLQDSAPRAALLSIHARVDGVDPTTWEHRSLIQLWGPRFNDYVVSAKDLAVFSLGRLPTNAAKLARAVDTADRLETVLKGRRTPFGEAGRAMGVPHNSLRYAAPTGTVLLRWDGARQPVIWSVPRPDMEPEQARLELARRHLHISGPSTPESFAKWAGIANAAAKAVFKQLARSLTAVQTPSGDAWILAADEPAFRAAPEVPAPARLLPSGDAYFLAWGADREILVPEHKRRVELWTSRVWPGALLVAGEIAGTWRRSATEVSISAWRRLSPRERESVELEAVSLPLPALDGPVSVRWS